MQEVTIKDPVSGAVYRTNPCRDIAWFAPQLVKDLEKRLSRECLSSEEVKVLDELDGWDELKAAYAAFCLFWERLLTPGNKSPRGDLEDVGFFKTKQYAQNLILLTWGKTCLGAAWAGMKSAYFLGEEYPPHVASLVKRGNELVDELAVKQ